MAAEIAQGYGVTLTGVPAPRRRGEEVPINPLFLFSCLFSSSLFFRLLPVPIAGVITATAAGFTTTAAMADGDLATVGSGVAVAGLGDSGAAVATSVALAVGNLVEVARDGIGSEKT